MSYENAVDGRGSVTGGMQGHFGLGEEGEGYGRHGGGRYLYAIMYEL
jgi:hypothetical protein